MVRIVQLDHPQQGRRVALVDEPNLRLLRSDLSLNDLAHEAVRSGQRLRQAIDARLTDELLLYDEINAGQSAWRLLTPIDHPQPSRCYVTGTGLTHRASAENRQSMHITVATGPPSDSMKMYQLGVEGGRPAGGCIGASPEWFYKGVGTMLRAHNEPLTVPAHSDDGGDEAEIAGVYFIGDDGTPFRIGFAQGNEFSDHVLEAKNYLYLAQSKLRDCSLGPELVIDGAFDEVRGQTVIERGGNVVWQAAQASGERWMCHSLANLEHHHFKHAEHRRPGDIHVHFFGADMFSFKDRLRLEEGDVMQISFEGFGRPLRNPVHLAQAEQPLVTVKPL